MGSAWREPLDDDLTLRSADSVATSSELRYQGVGSPLMAFDDPYTLLELIGTVAFAVSGGSVAVRAGMDWLGVAVLAAVTAVGGGTLRDLLLGQLPVGGSSTRGSSGPRWRPLRLSSPRRTGIHAAHRTHCDWYLSPTPPVSPCSP